MHEINDSTAAPSLQYTIDSLDDFRATAYQCGLQAMDKAQERTLTPIYFSSTAIANSFDLPTGLAASKNYYTIKDTFSKI